MPKKRCKLEILGHDETVQDLMAQGITTRAAIHEVLRDQYGLDVSEATVGRYIARVRGAAESEAFRKIQDHVNKTVPADLDALEEMEAMCLEWSRQAGVDQTTRVATAALAAPGLMDRFRAVLCSTEINIDKAVHWMIKELLALILADDRRQEQRLSAMRMAHHIIETKLSKAGLLDDEQKGRIVLLQQRFMGHAPDGTAGRTLRLVGGNSDE